MHANDFALIALAIAIILEGWASARTAKRLHKLSEYVEAIHHCVHVGREDAEGKLKIATGEIGRIDKENATLHERIVDLYDWAKNKDDVGRVDDSCGD